jgi:hypothetical protein
LYLFSARFCRLGVCSSTVKVGLWLVPAGGFKLFDEDLMDSPGLVTTCSSPEPLEDPRAEPTAGYLHFRERRSHAQHGVSPLHFLRDAAQARHARAPFSSSVPLRSECTFSWRFKASLWARYQPLTCHIIGRAKPARFNVQPIKRFTAAAAF